MIASPLIATGTLALIAMAAPILELGGMLVAGSVVLWFLLAGGMWLAVGVRPGLPSVRTVLLGAGLFAVLWVGVGLIAGQLALRWLLVAPRLVRWPIAVAAVLPWFLAVACSEEGRSVPARAGLTAAQIVLMVAALAVAGISIPGLYIVVLVIPALPVLFAITAAVGGVVRNPWARALGNALFFGWVLMAVFPLAG